MLADSEFNRIVSYVMDHYGISLSEKRVLVNGRLEPYLLRSGHNSFDEFMAKVEADPQGEEATSLINVLTTNHTYFMRESEHFDYFRNIVLPYLKHKMAAKKDLRIWSAASSTGEEPYTLAMILMDFFGAEHGLWDTRVLATDISTRVLQHAMKGVYLREEIEPVPDCWKKRFFRQINAEEFQVTDELRREVLYRRFNLMDSFPFKGRFHVVFLRNVMIYFPNDVKSRLIDKVYEYMEPGGYLFIGTTESLKSTRAPFQYVQPAVYRKKES